MSTSTQQALRRRQRQVRARAIAAGTWAPWGSLEAARGHIRDLLAAGWTLTAIARAAGIADETVFGIHRGARQRITAATEERLALVSPRARIGMTPAAGTTRRLQALAVAGHALRPIAAATGLDYVTLHALRAGRTGHVHPRTARAVAAIYPRLLAARPTGRGPSRVRALAGREGWQPASAWTRYTLDDPGARPLTKEPFTDE